MPRIIAIVNQKGGVGKTTTACNLSACLAGARRRTLLVDLDAQAAATLTLGISPEDCKDLNSYHVLHTPTVITDSIINVDEFLYLIPAHIDLEQVEWELHRYIEPAAQLRKAIKLIADQFDYILLDCPPNLLICTRNALGVVSEVIIPFEPSTYSFAGYQRLCDLIVDAEQSRSITISQYALLCRCPLHWNLAKDSQNALVELFGDNVLPPVRQNSKAVEAAGESSVVVWSHPSAISARDFIALAKAILDMESARDDRTLTVVGGSHG